MGDFDVGNNYRGTTFKNEATDWKINAGTRRISPNVIALADGAELETPTGLTLKFKQGSILTFTTSTFSKTSTCFYNDDDLK